MADKAQSYRDPIAFVAEQLGAAKTEAADTGAVLAEKFRSIERHVEQMREHGLDVGRVTFDDPVVQAAWLTHIRHELGPPMMRHEEEIALRVVGE